MHSEEFTFDRVMIVDDTKIDRYVATHAMKKNNFSNEIIEFDMATKAIDFLERNQDATDLLPQLIVLDIRMPEMDGFQFLETLSKLPRFMQQKLFIIMLSSSLDPFDHERAENNPAVKKFMNKPLGKYNLDEIKALYLNSTRTSL